MTEIKKLAGRAIQQCRVLEYLEAFTPEVVSTIFADLDIAGSDIDIVCQYENFEDFSKAFKSAFVPMSDFEFLSERGYAVGRFSFNGFRFEIYASKTQVQKQDAYRHFQIMKRLSKYGGAKFRSHIRKLKVSGLKTEPAICKLLSVVGNPYKAILDIESWSEDRIKSHINEHVLQETKLTGQ